MKTRFFLLAALLGLLGTGLYASGGNDGFGGWGMSAPGYGMGMHGYFGAPPGSAGPGGSGAARLAPAKIEESLKAALARYGNKDWQIAEIMAFEYNDYAEISDGDRLLMELLIDPWTGAVRPEYGPNMMWNTEFSRMGGPMMGRGNPNAPMTVSETDAVAIANRWLAAQGSSWATEDHPDRFPGYYTLHTLDNGKITGMLSVNGYGGQVWFHDWHGAFLGMIGEHADESGGS